MYLTDVLHFQVMVARAQSAHFVFLAPPRTAGDRRRLSPGLTSVFLDARKVTRMTVAAVDCPARATGEHLVHFAVVEVDVARAANAGGNRAGQFMRQRLLHGGNVLPRQSRIEQAN